MSFYIGLDLGTSVLKGQAINDQGKLVASFKKDIPLISRQSTWAEQSPEFWWSSALEIINLIGTKIDNQKVKGIGLSGQMHGLVTYDKNMTVIRRAIVWLDKRSQQEVEYILKHLSSQKLYKITGNPIFTGFLIASLLWIKNHEKKQYQKIYRLSSPKDYLAFKLTKNLFCEPTDALATGAFNYQKNNWSKTILSTLKIKPSLFPKIIPTNQPYGGLIGQISKLTGIPQDTPVYGGSDQSMAAMGNGLISKKQALISVSTGGQFLVIAKKGIIDPQRRLHTLNHALPNIGLYMAATLSASLSLTWFKNQITQQTKIDYSQFVKGVSKINPGSDGVFFLPFLAGERTPYFNPNLKGSFFGLSVSHKKAHLNRAIMEGVAYSLKDCLEVFHHLKLPIDSLILSGGGAKNKIWRQIIADVLNQPLVTTNITDHSPFGAAIFAKFAQQGFKNLPQFYQKVIKKIDYIYPSEINASQYSLLFKQYKKTAQFLNQK